MRVYFVRHGESEANLLREFSNTGLKHPLTEKGRRQAHALADWLRTAHVARIYTSPLLRAQQTAQILAQELGVPLEVTDALCEYSTGVLEGRSDAQGWAIYDQVDAAWRRGEWEQRIEGGESLLDMRARFEPLIRHILREYAEQPVSLVLVGHGGLYRNMLPLALSNISPAFAAAHGMGNTAAVIAEPSPQGLICMNWCGETDFQKFMVSYTERSG